MARPLRIEFDGAWYHVMNRGAGRRDVFRSAADLEMFLKLLGEASSVYGIQIHAYCQMRNHYHLLIHTPQAGLGRAMRHIDGVFTQRRNRRVGTDGALFRGRYKSVLIGEDSHLRHVSRYIHLNPVEARRVIKPENYESSSYRAFIGLAARPPWLYTRATLEQFRPGDSIRNYRRFVERGLDAETRAFYSKQRLRPVMGSVEFRQRMENRVRATETHTDTERPDLDLVRERPTLEAVAAAVCDAFEVTPSELRPARRGQEGDSAARGAFVQLAREVGGQTLAAIAKWIGYSSYAGASRAMGRFREMSASNPGVGACVESARRELTKYRAKT